MVKWLPLIVVGGILGMAVLAIMYDIPVDRPKFDRVKTTKKHHHWNTNKMHPTDSNFCGYVTNIG
jgi:hypothetical protein